MTAPNSSSHATKILEPSPQLRSTKILESSLVAPDDQQPADNYDLWSDGENAATLWLRAAFTLLAGTFLAYAQQNTIIEMPREWNRWIQISVVSNFLVPLFIIWMFFGQGLRRLDWLRDEDQKLNAWNYGWNWSDWKTHWKWALGMFVVMLPVLWWQSQLPANRIYYENYFPAAVDSQSWAWLFLTITIYMFCWEWFFRGFLLFGIAQGSGPIIAIIAQAVLFGLMHGGKPGPEMISSFVGGLILGTVAWRTRSFVPAFLTHALIHLAWAPLVLKD